MRSQTAWQFCTNSPCHFHPAQTVWGPGTEPGWTAGIQEPNLAPCFWVVSCWKNCKKMPCTLMKLLPPKTSAAWLCQGLWKERKKNMSNSHFPVESCYSVVFIKMAQQVWQKILSSPNNNFKIVNPGNTLKRLAVPQQTLKMVIFNLI